MPPPKGYKLDGAASFLAPTAATTKIDDRSGQKADTGNLQAKAIAQVSSDKPDTIQVYEPEKFDDSVKSHELTHVFQLSRDSSVPFKEQKSGPQTAAMYDYGGMKGLEENRKKGGSIISYDKEQQASIVEDYHRQTKEAIRNGDGKHLDQLKASYEPYLRELAALPAADHSVSKKVDEALHTDFFTRVKNAISPEKIDAKPTVPTPPSGVSGGVLTPSPLIGGKETSANGKPQGEAMKDKMARDLFDRIKKGETPDIDDKTRKFLGPQRLKMIEVAKSSSKK